MARRRFFVDAIDQGRAELRGEDARHLARVLRAEAGQRFEISDNQALYLAEIEEVRKDRVTFQVVQPLDSAELAPRATLLVSLIKFERFEWMVEKATELGVWSIVPVNAARSERGLLTAAGKRVERWKRIARESSQQSRRARLPNIEPPQDLAAVLHRPAEYRYLLEERRGARAVLQAIPEPAHRRAHDTICLLAGPEGGWTGPERVQLSSAGWIPVSLGPRILRTETSAIAALAVLASAWLVGVQLE
jgi:16S rRNA (uracil1498-N3)-methyltransferase